MIKELLKGKTMQNLLCTPGEYKPYPPRSDREAWAHIPDRDAMIAWGEKALEGYPATTATQYLAYVRTGDRSIMETPYFTRRGKCSQSAAAARSSLRSAEGTKRMRRTARMRNKAGFCRSVYAALFRYADPDTPHGR